MIKPWRSPLKLGTSGFFTSFVGDGKRERERECKGETFTLVWFGLIRFDFVWVIVLEFENIYKGIFGLFTEPDI